MFCGAKLRVGDKLHPQGTSKTTQGQKKREICVNTAGPATKTIPQLRPRPLPSHFHLLYSTSCYKVCSSVTGSLQPTVSVPPANGEHLVTKPKILLLCYHFLREQLMNAPLGESKLTDMSKITLARGSECWFHCLFG